jgi:diguanylate cyclase (GGDEF)-like protein
MPGRRTAAAAAAGSYLAAFVVVMLARPGGGTVLLWVSDVGTAVAGLVGAFALALRARHSGRPIRPTWALLAVGTLCAAIGDLLWSYDELIRHRETPFPSIADASYLLFPVFAGAGLLLHPSRTRTARATLRLLIDGVLVAGSLFALSWVTALGAVVKAGADSVPALVVGLAYPITDVVLLTLTVLAFTRSSIRGQPGLIVTAAALAATTVSDSAFLYLTAIGHYSSGNLVDAGFVASYLLFALAAVFASPTEGCGGRRIVPPPGWAVALPYVLCTAGVAASAGSLVGQAHLVPLATAAVLVFSLVTRQLITITDNRRLLADVAEREQRLLHQALHDDLTGLANRVLFADRLAHALTLQPREGRPVAVLFLGLDDFKLVNDSLGHSIGDALLIRVAERLRAAVRESDTVARLSGDEFAVLVEDSDTPTDTATRVAESFGQPFVVGDHTVPIRAGLGLAMVEAGPSRPSAEELLKRADLAMHSAKDRGKGRFAVFTPDLARIAADEFDIRDALAAAIVEGTVDVAYQPILATGSRCLLGFEALARWRLHGTSISPEVFLPVARRLGLIAELDELVLSKALAQLARWRRAPGCAELTCAVNADESLLDRGRAVALYAAVLRRHDLPPSALVVELPESHLSDSPDLAATVAQLRATGITVALDDFGTHGSSLSRLHRIRVDTVKLDRDFLRPGPNAGIDEAWLGGVIELAHRLGLRVVAEGVENQQQLQMLDVLGCDAVQGYLLGRPVPAGEVRLSSPVPLQTAL